MLPGFPADSFSSILSKTILFNLDPGFGGVKGLGGEKRAFCGELVPLAFLTGLLTGMVGATIKGRSIKGRDCGKGVFCGELITLPFLTGLLTGMIGGTNLECFGET